MMYNLSMLLYPFSNAKAYSVKVCIKRMAGLKRRLSEKNYQAMFNSI